MDVKGVNTRLCPGSMTHQYGVPMKESLLCNVLVFLADTPKSAERGNELMFSLSVNQLKLLRHILRLTVNQLQMKT